MGPLPNGILKTACKYIGVILTTYKSWDDPPNTEEGPEIEGLVHLKIDTREEENHLNQTISCNWGSKCQFSGLYLEAVPPRSKWLVKGVNQAIFN